MSFLTEIAALPTQLFAELDASTITITRTTEQPQTIAQRAAGDDPTTITETITTKAFRGKRERKIDEGMIHTETLATVLGLIKVNDRIQWAGSSRVYTVIATEEISPDDAAVMITKATLE